MSPKVVFQLRVKYIAKTYDSKDMLLDLIEQHKVRIAEPFNDKSNVKMWKTEISICKYILKTKYNTIL